MMKDSDQTQFVKADPAECLTESVMGRRTTWSWAAEPSWDWYQNRCTSNVDNQYAICPKKGGGLGVEYV